jgi:SAM-dependent methyltransferase
MDIEGRVAQHYAHGALESAILEALSATGKDIDKLQPPDLSAVDEFHLGGHAATLALGNSLELLPDHALLDIGSGIGGPARHFAHAHHCRVMGVDLSDEFVQVASALTRRCGLGHRVSFSRASGLALPFPAHGFDRATLIHVGMNIENKAQLFSEVRRVLVPGGRFVVYDLMRVGPGQLPYPLPWAVAAETSFVETPNTYRRLLQSHGFAIGGEHDRTKAALTLAAEMRAHGTKNGPPALGLHIIMGPPARERLTNVNAAIEKGLLAPIEMVADVV